MNTKQTAVTDSGKAPSLVFRKDWQDHRWPQARDFQRVSDEATVENALSEIKRLIGWLEYVPEHEFSATERERLITVSVKFAKIAQPIASKYID